MTEELKSPVCPAFEIRVFPSPRITAGNANKLILPGALVKAPVSCLSPSSC